MIDKRAAEADLASELRDGMTIGIAGWGSRRKPMALVRAVAKSGAKDLTLVSYGGPDVGILCALGRVKRVIYGFVSLDSIALEPHFRKARQSGAIEASPLDEGMLQWGLYAASLRLPFLPTRAGLGSDVMTQNPWLSTVRSPYPGRGGEPEELVAMPALELDLALAHVHVADAGGNAMLLGPDPYFDELYLGAAKRRWISAEKVVPTAELRDHGPLQAMRINRTMVDKVVEAPRGAFFTECPPDYGRDEAFQKAYAATAKDPDAWAAFVERWLDAPSHAAWADSVRTPEGGA